MTKKLFLSIFTLVLLVLAGAGTSSASLPVPPGCGSAYGCTQNDVDYCYDDCAYCHDPFRGCTGWSQFLGCVATCCLHTCEDEPDPDPFTGGGGFLAEVAIPFYRLGLNRPLGWVSGSSGGGWGD